MPIFSNHQMNYLANTAPAAAGDLHWNSVVCLLNGEDYVDKSKLGITYSMTTGSLNTSIKKFGNSSYYFPGTNGNRLTTTYNANHHFNGYEFTIEFWVYPTQWVSGKSTIMGSWNAVGQTKLYGWLCQATAVTNQWQFYMNHAGSGVFNSPVQVPFNLSLNSWNHVAYCRKGTIHKTFVNGVLASSVTDTSGLPVEPVTSGYTYNAATSSGLWIGENEDFNQQPFKGYIDEVRITNGVARYWNNFAVPTEAFPTTGTSFISATGGTTSTYVTGTGGSVTYMIHEFTTAGTANFTVNGSGEIDIILVGGGGGGGGSNSYGSMKPGGGGGGGVLQQFSIPVTAQTYNLTVGAGGNPGAYASSDSNRGESGGSTIGFGYTADGGGGGGGCAISASWTQRNGSAATYGGGGGGGSGNYQGTGGTSTYGGSGKTAVSGSGGGGGGSKSTATGNDGGEGNNLVGFKSASNFYVGGGGAAPYSSGYNGYVSGGTGGGGSISNYASNPGTNGLGGGGAAGTGSSGQKGGSGRIIIRYRIA